MQDIVFFAFVCRVKFNFRLLFEYVENSYKMILFRSMVYINIKIISNITYWILLFKSSCD